MSKRTNLATALQNASGKAPAIVATQSRIDSLPLPSGASTSTPPSRQGKKAVTGFFDPSVSRQLKQIALNEEKTVQALLSEALNDLFVKYNHKPIA